MRRLLLQRSDRCGGCSCGRLGYCEQPEGRGSAQKISETCQGKNVSLSRWKKETTRVWEPSALAYGHVIVASSPIDVNLAKQLNILLGNLGVATNKIVIDPTTGGLGYGWSIPTP